MRRNRFPFLLPQVARLVHYVFPYLPIDTYKEENVATATRMMTIMMDIIRVRDIVS